MNEDLKKILISADGLLERVTAQGQSVFALADARRMLKTAFDLLGEEGKKENG